jgi:hypothetical protein
MDEDLMKTKSNISSKNMNRDKNHKKEPNRNSGIEK